MARAFRATTTCFAFIAFLALVLALLPSAIATIDVETYSSAESFYFTTARTALQGCSCQALTDSFAVHNNGDSAILVSLSSSLPLRFSETSFALDSNSVKTIAYALGADCAYIYEGPLVITATTSKGTSVDLQKQVTVGKCQTIAATVDLSQKTAAGLGPCQNASGTLIVQNPATFPESYSLSMSANDLYQYGFKNSSLVLAPTTFVKIPFLFQFGCGTYGNQSVTIHINSERNNLQADIPVSVMIAQNYPYTVKLSRAAAASTPPGAGSASNAKSLPANQFCEQDGGAIDFTVRNDADVLNSYTVSFSSSPQATFVTWPNQSTIYLLPRTQQTFPVTFGSGQEGILGNYSLIASASSNYGHNTQQASLPVTIISCYAISLEPEQNKSSEAADAQSALRECAGSIVKKFIIKNNGLFTEQVSLNLQGPAFLKLSQDTLSLKPGEQRTVQVAGNYPDQTKTYPASLSATLSNGISTSTSFEINVMSQQSCFLISASKTLKTIGYSDHRVSVPLSYQGLQADYYLFSFNGTSWMRLASDKAFLGPQNTTTLTIITTQDENITAGTYDATIIAVPLSNPFLSYTLPVKIELAHPLFVTRVYAFVMDHRCLQIGLGLATLLFIALAAFALVPKRPLSKNFRRTHRVALRILLLLFAILIVGAAVLFYAIPVPKIYAPLPQQNDSLSLAWYQNDQYTLDLGQYFFSPEGQTLTYTSTGNEDVQVEIRGSSAIFHPKRGFTGTSFVQFSAHDEGNSTTQSPVFTLEILPVHEPDFAELVLTYCEVINILLAGMVVLTLFALFLMLKRKSTT